MVEVTRIFPPQGGGGGTPGNPTEVVQTVFNTTTLLVLGDGVAAVPVTDTVPAVILVAGLLGYFVSLKANVSPLGTAYTVVIRETGAGRQLTRGTFTPTATGAPGSLSAVFPGYQSGVAFFTGAEVVITGGVAGDTFDVVPFVGSIGVVP